jgi:dTDP-glucose pyrophosphorylase/predicted transcriptional regulator
MNNVGNILINKTTKILDAIKVIETGVMQIALVVDRNKKLLGTVNDGDIRRALLKNISLDDTIENVFFKNPTVANINDSKEVILNICKSKKIHQIPIVDNDNNIVGLEILDELIESTVKKNKVIIMVGGLGKRLLPLTEATPKPMLPVGGKPILQTIVENFVNYGFINIVMCIGYKSHVIQEFFEDGSKFGANIKYVFEDKRMGTAGALSLLLSDRRPKEPFFVMNGDLLTNVNFEHLLKFHAQNNATATMCVREYDFQVPYGVVSIESGKVCSIEEKPVHKFFVSAGIYMLNPNCLELIPNNEFFDMPTLFEKLIEEKVGTIPFPLREYWLDIGRIDDYEKANREYEQVFNV